MKIVLNQKFGLGNQLFQYAAGRYFAEKYNATLEIVRELESTASSRGHSRPFLLSKFNIATPVRSRTVGDRLLRSKSPAVATVTAPLRRWTGTYNHDPDFMIVGDLQEELPLPEQVRTVYLNGHFQVRQYAERMESQMREELRLRDAPTGKNLDMLQRIQQTACPVSLHFRRGDYATYWKGANLLSMEYYQRAVAAIREIHPDPTFFVFSDDIAAAREVFPMEHGAVYVDHNTEDTPHEDLRLISACHHHIVANSTFSWWSAWLNPKPDKVVLTPDPWHITDPHPNLIPPSWRKIASRR